MKTLSLEYAILAVLAFSDLFDFPLTAEEIWRNLFFPARRDVSFFDVLDLLENNPEIRARAEFYRGFYFLKGKRENVNLRLDRYVIAEQKYTYAKKIIRMLGSLPFVRMVCVCNSLGWSNARDESDIDFFIIAESGHLWTARLLCTGLMQCIGARPQKHHIKDTVCLSFFASDDALDLSSLFLEEKDSLPDIYFLYWIPHCVPIYDSGGVYERFWRANEEKVLFALPFAACYDTNERRRVRIFGVRMMMKNFFEICVRIFGNIAEYVARWIQIHILPQNLREIVNTDTRVVMNDRVLKFHQEDRREEIRERFVEKLKELGVV